MKPNLFVIACTLTAVLSGCASTNPPELSNKEKATLVLDNLGSTDQTSLKYISDKTYIQHNQGAASGKQGLLEFLKQFPATPKSDHSNIVRAFEDGNYVVLHSNLADANAVVFDIFRFKNGLIVEHWDNFQDKTSPNPSGHTQTDGSTKITDLGKTAENKALVK
ncbi:MAG: nuclear transport factor 2 family protein [Oceanospirillaceae bacterium]|nr:nuclear transport factor 2 family protein [Oceanospirillaceae bacterium]